MERISATRTDRRGIDIRYIPFKNHCSKLGSIITGRRCHHRMKNPSLFCILVQKAFYTVDGSCSSAKKLLIESSLLNCILFHDRISLAKLWAFSLTWPYSIRKMGTIKGLKTMTAGWSLSAWSIAIIRISYIPKTLLLAIIYKYYCIISG